MNGDTVYLIYKSFHATRSRSGAISADEPIDALLHLLGVAIFNVGGSTETGKINEINEAVVVFLALLPNKLERSHDLLLCQVQVEFGQTAQPLADIDIILAFLIDKRVEEHLVLIILDGAIQTALLCVGSHCGHRWSMRIRLGLHSVQSMFKRIIAVHRIVVVIHHFAIDLDLVGNAHRLNILRHRRRHLWYAFDGGMLYAQAFTKLLQLANAQLFMSLQKLVAAHIGVHDETFVVLVAWRGGKMAAAVSVQHGLRGSVINLALCATEIALVELVHNVRVTAFVVVIEEEVLWQIIGDDPRRVLVESNVVFEHIHDIER
mmetsp:Transcript_21479/g.34411  ORF Transcript_21479/g.34411 Transcript_21479/m.34411 type:complete len:319 (-) Transcript_21479:1498-2454(-)